MKATPKSTNVVIVAALALLVGYEALTLISNTQSTISESLWRASFETPMVGVAWGILTGHIFASKSKCVHCGLRAWAKVDDGRFGALLRKYHQARVDGVGHITAMQYARGHALTGDADWPPLTGPLPPAPTPPAKPGLKETT